MKGLQKGSVPVILNALSDLIYQRNISCFLTAVPRKTQETCHCVRFRGVVLCYKTVPLTHNGRWRFRKLGGSKQLFGVAAD